VRHPGAAQVRPPAMVGEGGGTLPGRLPFISIQIFGGASTCVCSTT
jgi:hypothetical protein